MLLLIWLRRCQVGLGGCGPPTWAQVLAAHQFLAPGLANGAVDTPGPELHGSLGHGRRADLALRHLLCRLHPQMSSKIKRFPAAAGELRLKASRIEINLCVYGLVYVTGSVSDAILCLMLRPLCAKKVRRFLGAWQRTCCWLKVPERSRRSENIKDSVLTGTSYGPPKPGTATPRSLFCTTCSSSYTKEGLWSAALQHHNNGTSLGSSHEDILFARFPRKICNETMTGRLLVCALARKTANLMSTCLIRQQHAGS